MEFGMSVTEKKVARQRLSAQRLAEKPDKLGRPAAAGGYPGHGFTSTDADFRLTNFPQTTAPKVVEKILELSLNIPCGVVSGCRTI